MCLGVPAEVLRLEADGRAEVSIAGAVREARVDLVPDVAVGDYVLLHAGFALQRLDADAAQEILDLLREMVETE
jgi:hydrogenase expression/formation protein HypC